MNKIDRLAKKIQNHELICGTHTFLGGAVITEMYGKLGFDAVWIDGEHGYLDRKEVLNALIGADTSDMVCFYRVPWNDFVQAKPFLDMGVHGIIFPMVNSAQEAEKAVAACRYPPKGNRGWGPRRASGYGQVSGQEYANNISKKIWCVIQIEHIEGVNNLDEILKVDGIDAIIIGPCDLSASLGVLPQIKHPLVIESIERTAKKCNEHRMLFGVSLAGNNREDIIRWRKLGASIIFLNDEANYIINGAGETLKILKSTIV